MVATTDLTRRAALMTAGASLLFLPGCFPLFVFGRMLMRPGLIRGLARGAGSGAAAMTGSIGRANAFASRSFSAVRGNRQPHQARDPYAPAMQIGRGINNLQKLDRFSIRNDTDPDKEVAFVQETEEGYADCHLLEKNRLVRCWERDADRLLHYFATGDAVGTTRIVSPEEHLHFADPHESSVIGRDIIYPDRIEHYLETDRWIGTSRVNVGEEYAQIVSSNELEAQLNTLIPARSDGGDDPTYPLTIRGGDINSVRQRHHLELLRD